MSDLTIYTNRVDPPWNPAGVLAGSEEAVVLLAEAVAQAGHTVQVYASLARPAFEHNAVNYYPRESFDPCVGRRILVTWKDNEPWLWPRRCATAIHWTADVEPKWRWPRAMVEKLDAAVVLSTYHGERTADVWGDKLRVIPLGVPERYTKPQASGQRAARALYTSSPDRGLEMLLRNWAAIAWRLNATAGLACTYPFAYQMVAPPGVQILGALPTELWDKLVSESTWWVYPLHGPNGPVPDSDIFSLNAVKVQALGCIPVVTQAAVENSGLRDTVKRYIELGELIRTGDSTVRINPRAVKELPLTWPVVYRRFWKPLFNGSVAAEQEVANG